MHRLRFALIATVTCLIAGPAVAAETWKCEFRHFDGPPGYTSQSTIEINGEELKSTSPGMTLPSNLGSGFVGPFITRYKILENNKLGVVASWSQVKMDKNVGVIVSADTITLNKLNGKLHEASVAADYGAHDALEGSCQLAP